MNFKSKLTHVYKAGRFKFRKMIGRIDVRESDSDISDGKYPFYYQVDSAPPVPSITIYANKVTITSNGSTSIRYTTDGSDPSIDTGTVYSGPFLISKNTTVKAIALFVEVGSSTATKECEYTSPPAAPSLSQSGNTITLTASSVDSTYYTIDGSDPDSTKTKYEAPFDITANCTVKAVSYKNGVKGTVLSQSVSFTESVEEVS